jgi:hypothetical protein
VESQRAEQEREREREREAEAKRKQQTEAGKKKKKKKKRLYPLRPGQPPCLFYLDHGYCARKRNCHFNHPDLTEEQLKRIHEKCMPEILFSPSSLSIL